MYLVLKINIIVLNNFNMHEPNFMGKDGYNPFFQGVVEDRIDPLQLGRIKVRVLGLHTEQKSLIPTEDLFWCDCAFPLYSASVSGIGNSLPRVVPGSWVLLYFRDGPSFQDPVILFSLPGRPEVPANNASGFSDPRDNPALFETLAAAPKKIQTRSYPITGQGAILVEESAAQPFPRVTNPLDNVLNEPDVNRLARNDSTIGDTIVATKISNRDLNVPIALGADTETWDEPVTGYNAQYSFNSVFESESGHIIEIDDTPNNERLHTWHRTGTFEEIQPDGSKIIKVVMDNYEITLRDKLVDVRGTCDVSVQGNINLYVGYNANIEINNNANVVVKGNTNISTFGTAAITTAGTVSIWNQSNCDITTEGNTNILTKGTTSIETEKDTLILSKGATSIETDGSATIFTRGDMDISTGGDLTFSVMGNFNVAIEGAINLRSQTEIKLLAPSIELNPPSI